MESREQLKQQVSKEKRLTACLALAKTRLEDAEREHIWAIAAAHAEGLSIRKRGMATILTKCHYRLLKPLPYMDFRAYYIFVARRLLASKIITT